MSDKEQNLDADARRPSISAGIPNMVNGHIIAITVVHNVMQENNLKQPTPKYWVFFTPKALKAASSAQI
jgi:hypothetical protein